MGDRIGKVLQGLGEGASEYSAYLTKDREKQEERAYKDKLLEIALARVTDAKASKAEQAKWRMANMLGSVKGATAQYKYDILQSLGLLDGTEDGGSAMPEEAATPDFGEDLSMPADDGGEEPNAMKGVMGFSYTPPSGGRRSLADIIARAGSGGGKKKGGGGAFAGEGKPMRVSVGGKVYTVPKGMLQDLQQQANMAADDETAKKKALKDKFDAIKYQPYYEVTGEDEDKELLPGGAWGPMVGTAKLLPEMKSVQPFEAVSKEAILQKKILDILGKSALTPTTPGVDLDALRSKYKY